MQRHVTIGWMCLVCCVSEAERLLHINLCAIFILPLVLSVFYVLFSSNSTDIPLSCSGTFIKQLWATVRHWLCERELWILLTLCFLFTSFIWIFRFFLFLSCQSIPPIPKMCTKRVWWEPTAKVPVKQHTVLHIQSTEWMNLIAYAVNGDDLTNS